ncbi:sugar transferase [bacterium]|nr:sugar transferase [bacterium]
MWVRGRGIVSQVWWVGEKSAGKELKGLLSLRFTGLDFLTFSPKEGIQDELRKRLLGKRIHLLLLDHSLSWEQARAIRHAGQRRGIPVRTLPRLEGTLFLSVDEVGIPLWGERLSVGTLPARIAKRLFDFLVGLPMLLVLILPALVVAFLIWVVDKNPPLYSHRRMGRSGRPFLLLKFRSMRPIPLEKLLEENPKLAGEFSKTHKLENDPRITPLGAFLRKWSVDEWPQLVNIILGDMSVVGPRPVVEAELARYGDWQDLLLTVKPGLTGLWQVSGRSRLSYDARVRLDTWYVQNWSPWQDLRILFLTLPAVLTRRGAV